MELLFNTLDYAVYTYDIEHIILDNLQFMLSGQGRGVNKFDVQDQVISGLRQFSTNKDVHISVVIHPKKVDDDDELSIASVFGSAKATQESDNIFIMQNKHKFRYIDIRKNRFDGSIGRVPIGFNRSNKRYFELSRKEEEAFYRESMTIKHVIEDREKVLGTVEPYLKEFEEENASNSYDPKLNTYDGSDDYTVIHGTQRPKRTVPTPNSDNLHSEAFFEKDNELLEKVFQHGGHVPEPSFEAQEPIIKSEKGI